MKESKEVAFKSSWAAFTKLLYETSNSLGSRLHKKEHLTYVAYAQWPDKATFEKASDKVSLDALSLRNEMRDTCENVSVLMDLDVEIDLTKATTFQK